MTIGAVSRRLQEEHIDKLYYVDRNVNDNQYQIEKEKKILLKIQKYTS